nr:Chain P, Commissureless LPSY Peptide [synthetic construct]
TGLPSYDEALH